MTRLPLAPLPRACPALDDKLDGWKAIADHLGKTVKTAQRWERDLGLPIRRVGSGPAGPSYSVFAYTSEINEWLDGSSISSVETGRFGSRLMLGTFVGTALLVAAAASGYLASSHPGTPNSLKTKGIPRIQGWRFSPESVSLKTYKRLILNNLSEKEASQECVNSALSSPPCWSRGWI